MNRLLYAGSRRWIVVVSVFAIVGLASAIAFAWGYRTGSRRAFIRDRRTALEPDIVNLQPASWHPKPIETPKPTETPKPQEMSEPEPASVSDGLGATKTELMVDMAQPVRLTWPLDIGPDISPGRPDGRPCLRARQGAGQIQQPGTATALYPLRIHKSGPYQTRFRVRWVRDGVDSVECNNSWFAAFNDDPLEVVGGEGRRSDWHWVDGPERVLEAGIHWLRVEMREDGTNMDRAWIASTDHSFDPERMNAMPTVTQTGFATKAPPSKPHEPINDVEFFALPTASLVIGSTHTNEITVAASWQGNADNSFEGKIEVLFPTAPGVKLDGEQRIGCGPDQPFSTQTIRLRFPPETHRRLHRAQVRVIDSHGKVRFLEHIRFVKPLAWAFLGPFSDRTRMGGDIDQLFKHPADRYPKRLASRQGIHELNMAEEPMASSLASREWKIIDDGSCFNWSGAVDLKNVYGRVVTYSYAYAVTWINAERLLHHRPFSLQLDDQGWLWMNGNFLVARAMNLPLDASRLWVSARLDMGKNPVVLKVTQKHKFWGFRLDVVDWHYEGRRGDVITGVAPENWPANHKED